MKNKKNIYFLALLILSTCNVYATHNMGGEITFKHVTGLQYEITVTTYTKESSPADRIALEIYFGDGDSLNVKRINGLDINPADGAPDGEGIGNDVKKNIYVATHTYAVGGRYVISMTDPNRNEGIVNIPNSVSELFYIEAELLVVDNPKINVVNSVVFLAPPVFIVKIQTGYLFRSEN